MLRWTVLWGVLALNCGEEPMGRRDYQYVTVTCNKGINQQERLADQSTECSDARNVWAPDGKVVARPGYWGVGAWSPGASRSVLGGSTTLSEDGSGVFTTTGTFDSKAVETHWYLSWTDAVSETTNSYPFGLTVTVTAANSNQVISLLEYWNGNSWIRLDVAEISVDVANQWHLGNVGVNRWYFPWPRDMATTTLGGVTGYFARFTLKPMNGSTTFDSSTAVNSTTVNLVSTSFGYTHRYFVAAQFPTGVRVISAYQDISNNVYVQNTPTLRGIYDYPSDTLGYIVLTTSNGNPVNYADSEPASFAVVPQFGEIYISYNYVPTLHKQNPTVNADVGAKAVVETDPLIVGPGADYDPAFIPQLGTWPQAKYTAFHRGEMWAANFVGGFNTIRWSAGSPNYKVWPEINVDVLADRDQSPITGLYPFNQNMYVFKADSIWQMVFTGENDDKLNTYRAERIISGVGCVSNSSIQEIRGSLIFFGHDGIYAFDGTAVKKISDRINNTVSTLVSGKAAFSTSVNWRDKSLYLLGVTTAGAKANNLLLVWDYKNDAWWLWDDIEAVNLFVIKEADNTERVYFNDLAGRLFEFGVGISDYGTAINAYTITQRVYNPKASNMTRKMRLLEVNATNLANSATVEVQANDAPFTGTTATSLDFSDINEPVYGTATYGTSTYTGERERIKGAATLLGGEWFRAKISHSSKTTPFSMSWLQFGLTQPEGVRK